MQNIKQMPKKASYLTNTNKKIEALVVRAEDINEISQMQFYKSSYIPEFISNHDDERANPESLEAADVCSLARTGPLECLIGLIATCSIPIIDRTRRPSLAMRGDGSFANADMENMHSK